MESRASFLSRRGFKYEVPWTGRLFANVRKILSGSETLLTKGETRSALNDSLLLCPPPPPSFCPGRRAMISRVLAQAFLLVLVLASGVSFFSPEAYAQNRNTWRTGNIAPLIRGISGGIRPVLGPQDVTVESSHSGFTFSTQVIFACAKTETPTSTDASYLSGCQEFPVSSGNSAPISLTVTQTMIDNGGFVIATRWWSGMENQVVFGQWVPTIDMMISQRVPLSLVEGGSGTYTVKLNVQPTDDVTILVASNNAGVAVKAGSNPAGARQELTFTSTTWNTAQTVTVEALSDDNLLDERAILSHEASSGSALEYSDVAGRVNVNVMDDDYPSLMITDASAKESDETLDFTVSMSMASSRRVRVPWTVITDGADAGTADSGDYDSSAASGTLVFSEGSPLTRTISVPINDDSVLEGDETVKVSLGTPRPGDVRVSGSGIATGTIVDDDEETAVGAMSGEFSQGDTTVTVDSTLPEDTGLRVVLPTELESGGETIEDLVVTLREADEDVEIDDGLFGYTGDDADHVLVDVDVSPAPDAAVRICLPVTEELRMAAGERRLYLIRFSGGSWERLSSTMEEEMVCAATSGFSPFAVVYELMNPGAGSESSGSGGGGGCAISGENRLASPMFLAMLLLPLLFFGHFRKK